MHWILLIIIACFVFLASYNPRTGNLTKFFTPEVSVEDHGRSSRPATQRKAQSNSDTDESSE